MSMSGAVARCADSAGHERAPGAAAVLSFSVMVAAHSTERAGLRPAARLALILLLGAVTAAAPAAPAADTAAAARAMPAGAPWMQIESRIESGYFQQDAAGLA